MIELLERSPTLPHTYQRTAGNDGNCRRKTTVNSNLGFEAKNTIGENISLSLTGWNIKGTPKLVRQLLPEVQGTSSWCISWMLEQHEDQAQSVKSSSSAELRAEKKCRVKAQNAQVQNSSSADQVQSEGQAGNSARAEELLQRKERLALGAHLGRGRICMLEQTKNQLVKDKLAGHYLQGQIVKEDLRSEDEGQLKRISADKSKLEELLKSGCKQMEMKRSLNGLKKQPARTRPSRCRSD
ncbi:ABC transporter F family member 4 [Dorcoceras hygrometricum]|uniref:ABC transporter F family member 4 n=1 Tax=Dorcoceras hygrometricum TaxID=472368 RepID=A0A2Z7BNX7_9LAMI|nr:ABC transporter F family member 4 [Dorcoceras hygrometricum]